MSTAERQPKGAKASSSKMVLEMFTITEDLVKHKETHTAFKEGECLYAHELSNKTGKSEHEDGQRLAVVRGVDIGLLTHGCL